MDLCTRNVCIRCGHTWKPHAGKEASKVCPKCKSPFWNTAKREKTYFDPAIHDKSRNDFKYLLEVAYFGSPTAMAYHLSIEYPTLMRLIKANKNCKPLPKYIAERVSELIGKTNEITKNGDQSTPAQVEALKRVQ